MDHAPKVLIIRFSSFGDIVQCLVVLKALRNLWPKAKLDWVVRKDFAPLLIQHPELHSLWQFDRNTGWRGLWELAEHLAHENYTHIYDAHRNLRSQLLMLFLRWRRRRGTAQSFQFVYRSKQRLRRWLLFRWRLPTLPAPFVGQRSFLEPLLPWGVAKDLPEAPTFFVDAEMSVDLPDHFIALVPSAAWEMKRWPVEYWQKLIEQLPAYQFVILGGPEDDFCEELASEHPERVLNLAGRLTLDESCQVLKKARLVIANDTGLLHVADALGRRLLALIGPTAFGYPARSTSDTLEVKLWCKPCSKDGRGRCKNRQYKKCLQDLSPETVAQWVSRSWLEGSSS